MAVNPNDLFTEIDTALKNYSGGAYKGEMMSPKHLKVLGDTMQKYFLAEIEVSYGWAAVLPPPASTPDPMVMFDSTVKIPKYDLTATKTWLLPMPPFLMPNLGILIQAAHAAMTLTHPAGFAIPDGTFLCIAPPPLLQDPLVDPKILLRTLCIPVCTWYLGTQQPAVLAGAHIAWVGATVSHNVK